MDDATKAPERIKAWPWNGKTISGQWHVAGLGETRDYILATPEALANAPEVAALIAAAILDAQLRCMERGRIDTPNEIRTAAAAAIRAEAAALRGEKEPK